MDKTDLALIKLAVGLLSMGAVAGLAGRLGAITAREAVRPPLRDPAPAVQPGFRGGLPPAYGDEEGFGGFYYGVEGDERERWGGAGYRLAPPGYGYGEDSLPWRSRSRYS